jgi:PPM family protein phosphatase
LGDDLRIHCGALTDQGKVRNSNEDYFIAEVQSKLFLVADGMGGHAAGEIASRMTAEKIEAVITGEDRESGMEDLLLRAVREANSIVYESQKITIQYRGMGSTLTVLTFSSDRHYVAHVGDSRAYLLRGTTLTQLTQDHSLVWPLYQSGVITKDEISRNPRKNLITRSIGTQPQVEAELHSGPALEGDIYILCSDGLTDVLSDDDIGRILLNEGKDPQQLSELLVEAAILGGGPDNVTVVVVHLAPE